jgi:hypothetical protein
MRTPKFSFTTSAIRFARHPKVQGANGYTQKIPRSHHEPNKADSGA